MGARSCQTGELYSKNLSNRGNLLSVLTLNTALFIRAKYKSLSVQHLDLKCENVPRLLFVSSQMSRYGSVLPCQRDTLHCNLPFSFLCEFSQPKAQKLNSEIATLRFSFYELPHCKPTHHLRSLKDSLVEWPSPSHPVPANAHACKCSSTITTRGLVLSYIWKLRCKLKKKTKKTNFKDDDGQNKKKGSLVLEKQHYSVRTIGQLLLCIL